VRIGGQRLGAHARQHRSDPAGVVAQAQLAVPGVQPGVQVGQLMQLVEGQAEVDRQ